MSSLYEVVPASVRHVKPISLQLRPQACVSLLNYGLHPRASLRRAFMGSFYAKTATLDGNPVAMWGAQGPAMSDHAMVWVAMGQSAMKYPLAILRRAREELRTIAHTCGDLYAHVSKDDPRAVLFAETLGFQSVEFDENVLTMLFAGRA